MRDVSRPHRWASGGGGLVSSAGDYLRFCQMLLNGGELDEARVLAPGTIHHMTADHLPTAVGDGPRALWCARPGARDGLRFWFGLCRADRRRSVPIAGFSGRIFLGWGLPYRLLDRPGGATDSGPDAAGARAAALLPPSPSTASLWSHYRTRRLSSLVEGRRNIQCGRTA